MRAEYPHRLPGRRAHGRAAEAAHDSVENTVRRFARLNDAGGEPQRPRRGGDEDRRRFHVALKPAAGGELVLDQPVRGRRIGHPQERLGEHHQCEAFTGRERISVQEIVDAAEAGRSGADRFDEFCRPGVDPALGGAVAAGAGEKARRQSLVGWSERRLKSRKPGVGRAHCVNLAQAAPKGAPSGVNAPTALRACRGSSSSLSPCPADKRPHSRPPPCRVFAE